MPGPVAVLRDLTQILAVPMRRGRWCAFFLTMHIPLQPASSAQVCTGVSSRERLRREALQLA